MASVVLVRCAAPGRVARQEVAVQVKAVVGTGICFCGADMTDHDGWDNHSPKQMFMEVELDEHIRAIIEETQTGGFSIDTDR